MRRRFSGCWTTCSGETRWFITTTAAKKKGGRCTLRFRDTGASQEEQKLIVNLVRPKYFIPAHGEYRQLFRHAALAHQVGTVSGEILLLEDGHAIEFTDEGAFRRDPIPVVGRVCVDSRLTRRDRGGGDPRPGGTFSSEDGIVVPIIAIDKRTGRVETRPEMVTRGFLPSDDGTELLESSRQVIMRTIEQSNPEDRRATGA